MIVCPRCDGQGSVLQVEVIKTHQSWFVCNECEATWNNLQDINWSSWDDFGTRLEILGLRPEWNEVRVINDAL